MKLISLMQRNTFAYLVFRCKYDKDVALRDAKVTVALGVTAGVFVLALTVGIVVNGLYSAPQRAESWVEYAIKLLVTVLFLLFCRFVYRFVKKCNFDTAAIDANNATRYEIYHYLTVLGAGLLTVVLVIAAGIVNGYLRSITA